MYFQAFKASKTVAKTSLLQPLAPLTFLSARLSRSRQISHMTSEDKVLSSGYVGQLARCSLSSPKFWFRMLMLFEISLYLFYKFYIFYSTSFRNSIY